MANNSYGKEHYNNKHYNHNNYNNQNKSSKEDHYGKRYNSYNTNRNSSQITRSRTRKYIERNWFKPNFKYNTILIYALLFVLGTVFIYKLFGNLTATYQAIGYLFKLTSPFIVGMFIALILYHPVHFFYSSFFMKLLHFKSKKLAKWLSIIITYIIAGSVITVLMVFIVPQLYQSITDIIDQLPTWYQNANEFLYKFQDKHSDWTFLDYGWINERLQSLYPKIIDTLTNLLTDMVPYILNTSMAIIKGIVNLLISIIASIYMIADHKRIFYNFKRLMYAILPMKAADTTKMIIKNSANIFLNYIVGKAIDSFIIAIITFICLIILKMPYAVLLSVIIGVTNMIPYFGPYIGGVIGGVIIVLINPLQLIVYIIMIIVIQQFDGLLLGPHILGDSTGLKPLWVIFGITVGGSLFGVLGMFLGVPVVAVVSYILNLFVNHLTEKKNITVQAYDSEDEM
ncbi:MAG: AI-2E family transporter [Lachnospira sp.]